MGERAAADIGQFAEAGPAVPRRLHELLGNRLAAFMIAAMGKLVADFVKHDVHVGLRTLVKFAQFSTLPHRAYRPKIAGLAAITTFSRN